MSYSKFVGSEGLVLYYNNKNNSLYSETGDKISGPMKFSPEHYENVRQNHGVRHKGNKPKSLRIVLGHACNYSCSYCMQKDIGDPSERPQNIFTAQFIRQVKENLDLSDLQRIELWGGEPFLYWKDMMKIMTAFDREGLEYYMSTNGSALQPKHLEFFLSLKARVAFTISHDGPGHERLRGADVLEKKGALLHEWDQHWPKIAFSVNPVLSDTNYDLFEMNKYFKTWADKYDIKHVSVGWVIGRVYDENGVENSALHVIRGDNLKKFKEIQTRFLDAMILEFKQGIFPGPTSSFLPNLLWDDYQGVFGYAQTLRNEQPITITSGCGADAADIISLDLNGAVRTCPHTDDSFVGGHITDIPGVEIQKIDTERKYRKDHCYNCPVYRICKSSCPINFDDKVFKMNCAIEKTFYTTVQQKSFELLFNQKITLVDWGLDKIPTAHETNNTSILQEQAREPQPVNN